MPRRSCCSSRGRQTPGWPSWSEADGCGPPARPVRARRDLAGMLRGQVLACSGPALHAGPACCAACWPGRTWTPSTPRWAMGADHGRRGHPGAAGRLPGGAAGQGRDRRRDDRAGPAMLDARRCASRCPVARSTSSGPAATGQHTVNISTMAALVVAGGRGAGGQARQPCGVLVLRLRRRARGARLRLDLEPADGSPAGRAGRHHVLLRARLPPGDALRRPDAPRARRRHGVQLPRPADQPGAAARARDRCGRPADGAAHGRCAGGPGRVGAGVPR